MSKFRAPANRETAAIAANDFLKIRNACETIFDFELRLQAMPP
jgi:hypothetical protein